MSPRFPLKPPPSLSRFNANTADRASHKLGGEGECRACGQIMPLTDFYINDALGIIRGEDHMCKKCIISFGLGYRETKRRSQ